MLKVGLTGGIGCGKSTVVDAFRGLGVKVIDADKISKDLVRPGSAALREIRTLFGKDILLPNGELNRQKLKNIVFLDPLALEGLENIIHPRVRMKIKRQLGNLEGAPYVVVDIPLLLEKNYQEIFDRIVVVDCLPGQQVKRVMLRGEKDENVVKAIIKKQMNRESRLKAATDILDNTGDVNSLKEQLYKLHTEFINRAKKAM